MSFFKKVFSKPEKLNEKEFLFNKFIDIYGYSKQQELKQCVDKSGESIPWYTYPSIEYLAQFDFSDKNVFEFGTGNSTLWWAKRCKKIVSVENNEQWYNSRLDYKLPNLQIFLKKEKEDYCNHILSFDEKFDIIIIDGTDRDVCAKAAIQKIKPNGMIIFDNSDRVNEFEEYRKASQYLKTLDFVQVDFMGMGPINDYSWVTSVYLSRDFNFKTINKYQPVKSIGGISEI